MDRKATDFENELDVGQLGLPHRSIVALVEERPLPFIRFALDREGWSYRVFRDPEKFEAALRPCLFDGMNPSLIESEEKVGKAKEKVARFREALEGGQILLLIQREADRNAQDLADRLSSSGAYELHLFEDGEVQRAGPRPLEKRNPPAKSKSRSLLSARVPNRRSNTPRPDPHQGLDRWKTMDQISQAMTAVRVPIRTLVV